MGVCVARINYYKSTMFQMRDSMVAKLNEGQTSTAFSRWLPETLWMAVGHTQSIGISYRLLRNGEIR